MTADPLPKTLALDRMETPIGQAILVVDEAGFLRAFDWSDHDARLRRLLQRYYGPRIPIAEGPVPAAIKAAITAYFAGDLTAIETIKTRAGGTDFQLKAWRALRDIPPGETRSYGQQAAQMGTPKAVRAVGLANGANPIGLIVPCHRVIGANGSLTGYGGGLERKLWLLQHEGAMAGEQGRLV
jgi:methylated-DNA-[protein]-cysteine S-methyltransferase